MHSSPTYRSWCFLLLHSINECHIGGIITHAGSIGTLNVNEDCYVVGTVKNSGNYQTINMDESMQRHITTKENTQDSNIQIIKITGHFAKLYVKQSINVISTGHIEELETEKYAIIHGEVNYINSVDHIFTKNYTGDLA